MSAGRPGAGRARQILLAGLLAVGLLAGRGGDAGAAPLQAAQEVAVDPCAHDAGQGAGQWDCLPFYRWADDADSFYSNFGYKSAGDIASSTHGQPMVTLLYGLAGMIWRLLMWITRTALAFDIFSATDGGGRTSAVPLQPLNDGFASVADVVLGGFGPIVLLAAVLVLVVRLAGPEERGLKPLVRPLLCLSLLVLLLTRSAPGPGGSVQAGSPAWFAERVIGVSNLAADQIATAAPAPSADAPPDNLLDCHYYVEQLRASFEDDAGQSGDMLGSVAFQPHLGALMSTMWETAYLDAWIGAQFGTNRELAHRTYCRMLEDRNGTPPGEQAAIHEAAMAAAGADVPAAGRSGYATAPFGRFNGDKDFRRGMVAWAVCGWYRDPSRLMEEKDGALVPAESTTGFVVNPEFRLMWNLGSPPSETKHQTCSDWWGAEDGSGTTKPDPRGTKWLTADGDGPFQFGTGGDIDEAFSVWGDDGIGDLTGGGEPDQEDAVSAALGSVAPYEAQDQELLPAAKTWVFSLNGHNLTKSVGNGFLAIVIALVFLWALGGLAIGVVFAQYLTVAYLVFKPVLLVVGMWPSEAAGAAFWKVTRIGIGSVLAKTVFVTVLSALVTLIHILSSFPALHRVGAAGTDGFGGGILYALTPLAAVLILRWAIKSAGLGNIFSLRGAVGLTGQLARGAGGMYDGPGVGGRAGALAFSYGRERHARARERRHLEEITRRVRGDEDDGDGTVDDRPAGAPALQGDGEAGTPGTDTAEPGARDRARALLADLRPDSRAKKAAWIAGAAVALPPLAAGGFAAAPLVGGVALARWAGSRTQAARRRRARPVDEGQDVASPPAAEDMADLDVESLRDGYSRYVATANAAGGAADPARSDHHPDVRSEPAIVGRELAEDGTVLARTASGSLIPLGTAPWGGSAGDAFTTRSGYRMN